MKQHNTLSLDKFFKMLRGNSTYQPTVSSLFNEFIVSADKYNSDVHGIKQVFVTPALFDMEQRSKNSFRGLNVLFAEIDDSPSTLEHLLVLKPTLKLRTSMKTDASGKTLSSFHIYWQLNETIKTYSQAQEALNTIKELLSKSVDKGGMKVTQLLRLPFTVRVKESDRQQEQSISAIQVMYFNEGLSYNLADFETWRTLPVNTRKAITNKPKPNERSEVDYAVMGELVKVGASTSLIKSIFDNSPVGDKVREKGGDYFNLTLLKIKSKVSATGGVEHNVKVFTNGLWLVKDNGNEQLTDFVPEVIGLIKPYLPLSQLNATLIHIRIDGEDFYVSKTDGSDKRKFSVLTQATTANVVCNPNYMSHFYKWLLEEVNIADNVKLYSDVAGIVKYKDVYTRIPSGESELIFNPANDSSLTALRYDLHKDDNVMRDTILAFENLNDKVSMQVMLGWFTSILFKSFIEEENINVRIPLLMITGGANIGKTTIIETAFKLFGIPDIANSSLSGTKTDFVMTKSMSASFSMPLFMKEVRANSSDSTKMSELLRSAYDKGSVVRRGTASQNVNDYAQNRPVVLDGQDPFSEIALIGRTLTIRVYGKKQNTKALTEYRSIVDDNNSFAYHLMNEVMRVMNRDRLSTISLIEDTLDFVANELIDSNLDYRSKANLGILYFGIKFLYTLAGLPVPDVKSLYVCYEIIYNAESNYLRNDATVLMEFILSQRRDDKDTTGGGYLFKDSEEQPKEKEYITFNLRRKVRSYNKAVSMSGMARTNVLSPVAYSMLLDEHGGFVKELHRGTYQIDVLAAKASGLEV